jgi:superfamily II helicase
MGNCNQKYIIKCDYCFSKPDKDVYIVTITHKGKYGGKNICSTCYEQKVLEKHKYNIDNNILPIDNN